MDKDTSVKVAIIDDSRMIRVVLNDILTRHGFKCISYGDPLVALGNLKLYTPDLILLDYDMPHLNGLEFIKEYKPKEKNVPIVMLTAANDIELALSCIRLGAADFLTKPVQNDRLIYTINKLIHENILQKKLTEKNNELEKLYSKIESELSIASDIQQKMMSHSFLKIKGFNISYKYLPSQNIGGDFFDMLNLGENQYGVIFADISGHGIPAALLTMLFKGICTLDMKHNLSPAENMKLINESIANLFPEGMFASTFFIMISEGNDVVRYCKACQEAPILISKNITKELTGEGTLVGLFSEKEFPQFIKFDDVSMQLETGDKILLYTDGIIEARNEAGEFYGRERLYEVIKKNKKLHAHDFIEEIYSDLLTFIDKQKLEDDLTFMVIEKEELDK